MKKFLIPFFLIGSLVMIYVMAKTGQPLKTPVTPQGILNLEFAYNNDKVNTIVNNWTSINTVDTIAAAKLNTWLDFIFLFFYSGFLFIASKRISGLFGGGFGKAGKFIGKAALFAGFLDILENIGMLLSLSGRGSDTIAFCTTFVSIIKWGLALLAVLYVLTGAIGLLRKRLTR